MFEFTAIRPSLIPRDRIYDQIEKTMHRAAKVIIDDYKKTTRTWSKKPRFYYELSVERKAGILISISFVAGTDNEIYGFVDKGTRVGKGPYPILPGFYTGKSDKKFLRFQSGYTAKTTPNKLTSSSGGPFGPFKMSQGVMHPGIEPRNFSVLIQKKRQPWFADEMRSSFKRAASIWRR